MRLVKITLLLGTIFFGELFAQSNNWSGVVFYELYFDNDNSSSFEINRAYLTYETALDEDLKIKLQTDVGRQKNDPDNPHLFVYLKNAKLDWKNGFGTLTFGLQSMNIFKIQEGNWGYRSIEKSAMDLNKWSSSADLGVGWYYKLGSELHGSLLITNGNGYKKPENDKYKLLSLQLFTGEKNLKQSGINAGGVATYTHYNAGSVTVGTKSNIGLFGGLATEKLRVGGEFDYQYDSEVSETFTILSFYGNLNLNETKAMFLRFDLTNVGDQSEKYIIFGCSRNPVKGLKITPNLRYTIDTGAESELTGAINFEFKF